MDPHCVWVILLTIRHVANFYLRFKFIIFIYKITPFIDKEIQLKR